MSENKNKYSTSNLFLATTLSLFSPIQSIEYTSPRQAEFIFEHDTKLDKLIEKYWKGALRVEPKELLSQLKIVKSRLYEGGRHG